MTDARPGAPLPDGAERPVDEAGTDVAVSDDDGRAVSDDDDRAVSDDDDRAVSDDDDRTLSGEPPARHAMVEALGGKRGLVDSGLPAVVFVFVNSVVAAFTDRDTGLRAALVAAVVVGVGVVALRLVRRETLQQALSGFFALAIAVWLANRSGEARDFFLPGIGINVVYGTVFVVSALVARPLVGYVYAAVDGLDRSWREDRRLRRAFAVATFGWGAVFAARAAVQGTLYAMDRPGLLAAAKLLMGWPLTILAVAATIAWVKRSRHAALDDAAAPTRTGR